MEATDSISVTLQAQQWNVVLSALAEAPWRISDPVIRAIVAQTQKPDEDAAALAPAKGNGAAEQAHS
jgi:hypothetical protein